jgi:two-component system heavy metal sensor histidine kinase CusS
MPILLNGDVPDAPDSSAPDARRVSEDGVRSGTFPVAPSAAGDTELRSLQRFKDDTVATLVHELSGPLAAMMMNLDFALTELVEKAGVDDSRNALAESRAAGAKLFRVIANLLDVARSHDDRLTPKPAAIDPDALLARALVAYAGEAAALDVALRSEVTLGRALHADPDLVARILGSLVESALRHADARGAVGIAVRSGTRMGASLTVTYEGRPISADLRAFIFEPFSAAPSTAIPNRGLGLYFSRLAAEAHGGSLEVVNGPGDTTCIRIELPRA